MNSAIGNSGLFWIVIFFISILMILVTSSISYSKAYRVKNKIIDYIETNESYDDGINTELISLGYAFSKGCHTKVKGSTNLNNTNLEYCVYKMCVRRLDSDGNCDQFGYYYKVITYTHFALPIVGNIINTPVSGETKILGKSYEY